MNDSKTWTQWQGLVADKTYRLEQFLGSSDHSAVFLTEIARPGRRKAAIKFISADFAGAERQLDAWKAAAQLSHPNLLQLYAEGRCRLEDMELLYVVMEYAEENLGQLLPQRAMTNEEARQVLNAATDVLVYLHDKGLTHGHLKPSNVLATGDQLKFSSDTIQAAGEVRGVRRERDAYDAPETASSPMSAAADAWSLGITVVEALTQQAPVLPFDDKADPPIPTLPEPFLEVARHTLRREAKWRWSSAQIAARLNPAAAAAATKAAAASAAAASTGAAQASVAAAVPAARVPQAMGAVSPMSVPLSKEPAVALGKQVVRQRVAPRAETRRTGNRTLVLPNYVVPVLAGVLALTAIIVLPRILRRHMESSLASMGTASQNSSAKPTAEVVRSVPKPPEKQAQVEAPAPAKPAEKENAKVAAEKNAGEAGTPSLGAAATSTPAVLRSDSRGTSGRTKSAHVSAVRGEVLEQVLPKSSEKALSTISGTVRVGVKAHVGAAGNVEGAELANPGPSRYFADQALDAARRWLFNTPEVEGRSVKSEWLIRFEFTRSGVKAFANQSAP
jgi:TonB family protein